MWANQLSPDPIPVEVNQSLSIAESSESWFEALFCVCLSFPYGKMRTIIFYILQRVWGYIQILLKRVLKELADEITGLLMLIFKESWNIEEVPEDQKKSNVVPIFKKGKRDDLSNYRQVSLTSILGKII